MKFKELTSTDKEFIKKTFQNQSGKTYEEKITSLAKKYGVTDRTMRFWIYGRPNRNNRYLNLGENIALELPIITAAKEKEHDTGKKRFMITAAQNKTKVHAKFFNFMEIYAKKIDAEILVIPYRYKNATSIWTSKQENDEWWDQKVIKYLTLNRHNLNNNIAVLSDIKVQPTASQPLQGLEGMTGSHSCVVGHPRMELKSVPGMGEYPKLMFTTGACTIPNYSDSKAGKKGEFHHTLGFTIVEIKDDEIFFPRQVCANNKGEFIDLWNCVSDGKVTRETTVEACIMGDTHVEECNPAITDVTLNHLFKRLKPKKVVAHDIMDSKSISHHNLKNPFKLHELHKTGKGDLGKEIKNMLAWLKPFEKYDTYIVRSNHDEHIDRFLNETDWRKMTSFDNAIPYMEMALAKLNGHMPNGAIPFIINSIYPKMTCLGYNDNLNVKGWLLSMHGHIGMNGSRGSLAQFSRLSTKSVTAHSHQIGRIGGAVCVGTSTFLRVDYNNGPSGWVNAHGTINRFGKFQHIIFIETPKGMEYTTFK